MNNIAVPDLMEQLDRLEGNLLEPASVAMTVGQGQFFHHLNEVLPRLGGQDHATLADALFRLWCEGRNPGAKRREEALEVFGAILNTTLNREMIGTVTADGRQARIWSEFPRTITANDVGDDKQQPIFSIEAKETEGSKVVRKYFLTFFGYYIASLSPEYRKQEEILECEVKVITALCA